MDPRAVTFVIFEQYQTLDLTGPFEVLRRAGYPCRIVAPVAGPVHSNMGLAVYADYGIAEADPRDTDTLLVVGGGGVRDAMRDRDLVAWIVAAAASADRVTSVCTGAFLLAEAGLLDGLRVTTHWRQGERLARDYPAVRVDCEPIFIQDGRVWTSAGVTAGMDLALALVELDLGREAALEVARELVMFLRRPGNQSQFSVPLWSAQPSSEPLRAVVDAIHANPGGRHGISDLADLAGMSSRHLQRRFTREVGVPPASYVERVRIEAAQRALAERDDPVESIARHYGFGTAETLRRAFHRLVGIAPSDYRDRFRTAHA
ncbi:GlxA family transcriptional regulator [Tenggerimyces flavus]|uniref:GlxA family transcriptional regulator n=1 Tax=Tenggerimyces flavus TaxID=1708749 RepID=A0ABV7Y724_9ACTN|nr:GlxA family transcriptional regulator [Tenggerimyces flavus]MBM7784999.1 transcriptional regulator GlxA family with amidase domain [Tenggerimyces flavus]